MGFPLSGDQLAALDSQRTRAQDAHRLIESFSEFSHGGELSNTFTSARNLIDAARTAKRLQTMAQDSVSPAMRKARPRIDDFCDLAEEQLLDRFEAAQAADDIEDMRLVAKTLSATGAGAKASGSYLKHHPFFGKGKGRGVTAFATFPFSSMF